MTAQIEIAGTRDRGIDIGWEWIEAFVCWTKLTVVLGPGFIHSEFN